MIKSILVRLRDYVSVAVIGSHIVNAITSDDSPAYDAAARGLVKLLSAYYDDPRTAARFGLQELLEAIERLSND